MHRFKKLSILLSLILVIGVVFGSAALSFANEEPENSVNLTVGENIVSHYYLDASAYESRGASKYRYSYNNGNTQEKTEIVSDFETFEDNKNSQGKVQIDVAQAAAQIAEPVIVEILNESNERVDLVTYTAKDYCDNIINMNDSALLSYSTHPAQLKKLCKAIVAYSKSAQGIFSSYMAQEGSVAITDDYSDELELAAAEYDYSAYTKTDGNIRFRSVSFMCESTAKMRFYFTPVNANDSTNYGDPVVSSPFENSWSKGVDPDGKYSLFIQINNIAPALFDEPITISYAGATIRMSVLEYAGVVIANSGTTAELKTLGKSLIRYNETAKTYFSAPATVYVPAKASTCTESGCIAHYELGGKSYSDADAKAEIDASLPLLAHSYGEYVQTEAPSCTNTGTETRTCSVCGAQDSREIAALGHSYTASVTEPTCSANGYTTYTCSLCGDTYKGNYTDMIAHTPASAVNENTVAATCTAAGSHDSVVYCSVCEAEISRETVVDAALGHSYGDWAVTTGATLTSTGTETRTCSRNSSHKETRTVQSFTFKLVNTDSYLYRVGNTNTVKLGTFFDNASGANITDITVSATKNTGNATCSYSPNADDWRNGTLKFGNTGVMTVTFKHGTTTVKTFKLEVVAGTNYAEGANLGSVNSNNAVLLGNVKVPSTVSINNGKTLYGNGFKVTDTRSSTAGTSGYINMTGGGTINNAVMLGQVYTAAVSSGNNNENYAPGIWITGNANIYNSYVSECKYAVQIDGGEVNLINSTFAGGAIANVCIAGGEVTLENCITSTSNRGGLNGLGVRVTSTVAKIILNGTFKQYNWLKKSEVSSDYSSILSSVYDDSNYAYTYNSQKYVNMGIFFISDSNNITSSQAEATIEDNTSNNYGYIQKTALNHTGTIYTAKASMGSSSMLSMPDYSETVNGQYFVVPNSTFNYTKNDFTTDDKTYCTYNSTSKVTNISFVEGSSVQWDTSILTVTKNGNSITPSVTMNNTDYTGGKITFTAAGDYNVVYSYTDPYNYDKDGNAFNHTYTKSVKIHVTTVEQSVEIYHPDFTYANIGGTTASKQVEATVSGAKRVYVMPNVSATSSSIGSKTVDGKTIYYPIVSVNAAASGGGSYSNGKIYYFAPAFKHINITDYDQDNQTTKTAKYTYNSSTQKWPHNISSSSKPDTEYYYYTSTVTSTNTNRPYGRSMNEQYYTYTYNNTNGGLCFLSKDIEKNNSANNQLVEFYYKGTDDITYYYYIQYKFAQQDYTSGGGGCVAEGSQVTMADGTKKAVEDVKAGDMVLTWSMWEGKFEAQPVIKNMYHGTEDWDVLTLNFSNGSSSRTVIDHGFYDADKNNYVYINTDNVESYIGDTFVVQNENGDLEKVKLNDYTVTVENVGIYNVISAYNINCFVDDVLTISPEVYAPGLFEYFNISDDMVFDKSQIAEEISEYGFYDYSQFSEYVSQEAFDMLNLKYYKIFVERGDVDYDALIKMIVTYICD